MIASLKVKREIEYWLFIFVFLAAYPHNIVLNRIARKCNVGFENCVMLSAYTFEFSLNHLLVLPLLLLNPIHSAY